MELGFQDEFRKKRKYEKVNDHFWAVKKAQLVQVKNRELTANKRKQMKSLTKTRIISTMKT